MNLQRKCHFFNNIFPFFVFFVVNILILSQYPFIHSDESWLSGLTRAIILNKSITVTESFFDLLPRYPHAIKILFHLLQTPFILLFGYSPFSVRLLSLLGGTVSLVFFHKIIGTRDIETGNHLNPGLVAIGITILLALDIQFLYASHLARQEILLVATFLSAVFLYRRGTADGRDKWYRLSALIIGLSIGIHPNSFLIALPIGGFLLVDILAALPGEHLAAKFRRSNKKQPDSLRVNSRRLTEYILILGLSAAFFIGLSSLMDPRFFQHYRSFGETVGVAEPLYMKFFTFPDYFEKLFLRISGTYYTPDIRFQFYLFGGALALTPLMLILRPRSRGPIVKLLLGLGLINLGTLVLGKYSQPGIVLHFPLYYLLLGELLLGASPKTSENKRYSTTIATILGLLLLAQTVNTGFNLAETIGPRSTHTRESYRDYTRNISSLVPPDARVLANLNTEYYFDHGVLRDYRNLVYLNEEGLSFADYIRKNDLEYIIYPEEMEVIYQRRPVWNILYGNVTSYYEEMKSFLSKHCVEEGSFSSPVYGMRITRYSGREDWKVTVYRVKN